MNWDYIAGFFDGEGNLHVKQVRGKNEKRAYQLQIRIYSTDEKILKEIQKFLECGQIYLREKTGVCQFTISNKKDCFKFLQNVAEKVILKRPQVTFLLNEYSFERNSNNSFDLDQFRSFITRKNVVRIQHNLS